VGRVGSGGGGGGRLCGGRCGRGAVRLLPVGRLLNRTVVCRSASAQTSGHPPAAAAARRGGGPAAAAAWRGTGSGGRAHGEVGGSYGGVGWWVVGGRLMWVWCTCPRRLFPAFIDGIDLVRKFAHTTCPCPQARGSDAHTIHLDLYIMLARCTRARADGRPRMDARAEQLHEEFLRLVSGGAAAGCGVAAAVCRRAGLALGRRRAGLAWGRRRAGRPQRLPLAEFPAHGRMRFRTLARPRACCSASRWC